MGNHLMVGGQAVIEGVMMRGPKLTATAVRDLISAPMNPVSMNWPGFSNLLSWPVNSGKASSASLI